VAHHKLAELDDTLQRLLLMKELLNGMGDCSCDALDACGAALLRTACSQPPRRSAARRRIVSARP
jgi:hypothetical protein